MLELLSPAGTPEAVVAAAQNGADAIYLAFGVLNSHRGAKNFIEEDFNEAAKYCRIRGIRVYLALDVLTDDAQTRQAVELASRAAQLGADAVIIQDMGLLRALRLALPELPVYAGGRMDLHSLAGVEAVAELGASRAYLAPELTMEQVSYIAGRASIPVGVSVHGPICFAHGGSCRLSAFQGGGADSAGHCSGFCRTPCSLGGRMDACPLSLKDLCLAEHIPALAQAGVACLRIEGPALRPEYAAAVTELYAGLKNLDIRPVAAQMQQLEEAFHLNGVTDGYLTGQKGPEMFAPPQEAGRDANRFCTEVRRGYASTESRRLRTEFYAVVRRNEPVCLAAVDAEGTRAVVRGPVPQPAQDFGLTEQILSDLFYRTGGTPYQCAGVRAAVDTGLTVELSALESLLHALLNELSRQRAKVPARRTGVMPAKPAGLPCPTETSLCCELRRAAQLTDALAEDPPRRLYLPIEETVASFDRLRPLMEAGTECVATLPRILTDGEQARLRPLLGKARELGIREVQVSAWGHAHLARAAGFVLRGGDGLNIRNSWAMGLLQRAGFRSVLLPPDLTLNQIAQMAKPVETELLIYGRPTLAVTDHCLMRNSTGRCGCHTPGQLNDRRGALLPVVQEYGCRNLILGDSKLYMADRPEDCLRAGVGTLRLVFTTESARECAAVFRSAAQGRRYVPNGAGRGLYYKEDI